MEKLNQINKKYHCLHSEFWCLNFNVFTLFLCSYTAFPYRIFCPADAGRIKEQKFNAAKIKKCILTFIFKFKCSLLLFSIKLTQLCLFMMLFNKMFLLLCLLLGDSKWPILKVPDIEKVRYCKWPILQVSNMQY